MQQRFCTCGQPIWVHYLSGSSMQQDVLFTARQDGDELLCICPSCGYTLNINEMP